MVKVSVNIDNKKAEKVIKAILDAFDLNYSVEDISNVQRHLSKSEQTIYNRLEKTAKKIESYKKGEIEFQSANDFLNEMQQHLDQTVAQKQYTSSDFE